MANADPLYDLLSSHILENSKHTDPASDARSRPKPLRSPASSEDTTRYLSRLLSLSLSDLTNTEPQSISQSAHSNLLSVQALSSRSYRSSTASSDRLATLSESLLSLERSTVELRNAVPGLDESAVAFATNYGRNNRAAGRGDEDEQAQASLNSSSSSNVNEALKARKNSQLLARQADKLQDMLELPSLLRASIAAASSNTSAAAGVTSSGQSTQPSSSSTTTSYTQALDLFTHIRRLQILYPDSHLIRSLQHDAELAMYDMTTALLTSLRSQNIRLAAAIRTIGWLRRVMPQLSSSASHSLYAANGGGEEKSATASLRSTTSAAHQSYDMQHQTQDEDLFGPLFLVSRLSTFLSITTDALSPLRDLADQETEKRLAQNGAGNEPANTQQQQQQQQPQLSRRPSASASYSPVSGQQTERYLKRYIEVFREHSFATVQMYRNIFPNQSDSSQVDNDPLQLPSAVASFPLHLVSLLTDTLQAYLPNVTDPAARESLLMQVLYAASSLGRLGADFSMMIALLDLPELEGRPSQQVQKDSGQDENEREPEWARVIKKHRIQAARLDALAANHHTT